MTEVSIIILFVQKREIEANNQRVIALRIIQ